jgi:sulfur-oxidizing protein SoxA
VRHVPDQAGSTRYDNLEYFHAYQSNGLPLQASVFRK